MFLPSGTFWIRLTSHRVAGRFVERISWSSGGEKEMAFITYVRKKGRRNIQDKSQYRTYRWPCPISLAAELQLSGKFLVSSLSAKIFPDSYCTVLQLPFHQITTKCKSLPAQPKSIDRNYACNRLYCRTIASVQIFIFYNTMRCHMIILPNYESIITIMVCKF